MPADSLQNMALHKLATQSRDIHDFGAVPVHLIKPVIPKITNPDQLRLLEQRSPQIVGHTLDVWLSMLKRDIPHWKERLPADYLTSIFDQANAHKWHKVYFKLKADVEAEKERAKALLVQGLKQSAEQRGPESVVRAAEPRFLKDPSSRKRKTFADASYSMNQGMYSKSKGEGFFDKVKRNAVSKAVSRRTGPSRALKPVIERTIKRAPLGMVEDIKEQKEAVVKNIGLPPPGSVNANGKRPHPSTSQSSKARTENANVTKLTADFLEDDDDDGDEADNYENASGSTNAVFNYDDSDAHSSRISDDELFGIERPDKAKHKNKRVRVDSPPSTKKPRLNTSSSTIAPTRPAAAAKRAPPDISIQRSISPMKNQGAAAATDPSKPMVLKRSKQPRSIFAKK